MGGVQNYAWGSAMQRRVDGMNEMRLRSWKKFQTEMIEFLEKVLKEKLSAIEDAPFPNPQSFVMLEDYQKYGFVLGKLQTSLAAETPFTEFLGEMQKEAKIFKETITDHDLEDWLRVRDLEVMKGAYLEIHSICDRYIQSQMN